MSNTNTNDPGEAAVPAGYRLGDGWEVYGAAMCTVGPKDKLSCRELPVYYNRGQAACSAHAVTLGALVPIEPPVAEPAQPMCAPDCGKLGGHPAGDDPYLCSPACESVGYSVNPPPVPPGPVPVEAPIEGTGLRPCVVAFAWDMERKLRANDHKGGWEGDDWTALHKRMLEEAEELRSVIAGKHLLGSGRPWQEKRAQVRGEAADVANFAMMLAENEGARAPAAAPAKAPLFSPELAKALEARVPLMRTRSCAGTDCTCEAAVAEYLADQLATALRELADEKAGAQALRERFGAKDNETFPMFIERLAAERDEQRGRAERAEAKLAPAYLDLLTEATQLRERLNNALATFPDAATGAYRTGWADGAEATREADVASLTKRWCGYECGHDACCERRRDARRMARLPLPPCPEGPPAGTAEAMGAVAKDGAK